MSGNYTTPDIGNWLSTSLAQNPGLAADVATTTQDKNTASDVLSQSTNVVGTIDAIQQHSDNNGTQSFWNKLGGAGWSALNFLSKPLQEVQRDYKFIHAVYQDHGVLSGLMATLGVSAGTIAGAMFAGPLGAAAGTDLAGTLVRKMLGSTYQDSYNKSEDANYKVSFGRDFSNILGNISDTFGAHGIEAALKNTNKGLGRVVSGAFDTIGDISMDPLLVLGKANMMIKTGKYIEQTTAATKYGVQAKYPLQRVIPGVQNFLAEHSMRTFTPEQMDAVFSGNKLNVQANQYRNGLGAIADSGTKVRQSGISSVGLEKGVTLADKAAGDIALHFPTLGTATAGRLGAIVVQNLPKKEIVDQIHNFFKSQVYFNEVQGSLSGAALLPSRTVLHPLGSVADYLRDNPNMVGKVYRTFSGYMPFSIDSKLQKISTEQFRWNSQDAAGVIYRIMRNGGMGADASSEMAGQYATAVAFKDVKSARLLNAEATKRAFIGMGLPDDHLLVTRMTKQIDDLNNGKTVGGGVYGYDPAGRGANVSDYLGLDGQMHNAGLAEHQASEMLAIPNFLTAKKALHDLGIIKSKLGYIDDFIADKYTNPIFKPLALATAGFGLRVSASELILALSRFGFPAIIGSKIASSAAKAGYKIPAGQENHMVSAVLAGLGATKGMDSSMVRGVWPAFQSAKEKGLRFAAKMTAPEQLDIATQEVIRHNGDVVIEPVSSGHGMALSDSYEADQQVHGIFMKQKSRPIFKEDDKYTTFTPDSGHYLGRYNKQIKAFSSGDMGKNITSDIADVMGKVTKINPDMTNSYYVSLRKKLIDREYQRIMDTKSGNYEPYKHESTILDRWSNQDPKQFATDRVDSILGLVIGSDGTIQHSIVNAIKNGESVGINDLKKMPRDSLPREVAGPMIGEPIYDANGLYNRVISQGFKKVFNPIINTLAREPLWITHVTNEYGSLKYAVSKGMLTKDQALTIAETRAAHAMLPQIHNTMLKNQFSVMARNFLPFYFAQEQSWKRTMNAMKDTSVLSPIFSSTVRTYQMIEQTMTDPTFVTTDSNGNRYVHIPIVGEWGQNVQKALAHFGVPMVTGLPISVEGNLASLKSVVPEMNKLPGVSPFVAVSGNILADWFPNLQPTIDGLIGQSSGRGFWDTVNPNAMSKTLWAALSPNEQSSAMSNALFSAMASAYYHNDPGFGPQATDTDREDLIARIKNNAKSILILKAALNLLSPLSPKVEQTDPGLREEFLKLISDKKMTYPDALAEFLKTYGTRAVSFTISKTTSPVPGATFPYVQNSLDWIDSHKNLVHNPQTSTAAMFLVPQNPGKTSESLAIFNDLLNQHLRIRRDPKDFITQFSISEADQYFNPLKIEHDKRVAELTANQDTTGLTEEANQWSGVTSKMQYMYPAWWTLYSKNAGQALAQTAVDQFRKIFSKSDAPTNEQTQLVKVLLQGYDVHKGLLDNATQTGDTQSVQDEKAKWKDYLTQAMTNDPRLKPVINSVFLRLDK